MISNTDMDYILQKDLYAFYRSYVIQSKFKENSKHADHIREIASHLSLLKEGLLDKYLAVSVPPRHSKSSLITIAFPLWLIFHNPDLNILIISNTGTLAEKFGIDLREFIRMYGYEFNIYLSDVKHSSTHIKIADKDGRLYNGSIRLTGASGSITGQDADYIIVDDPYKGEQDELTPSALEKKINWFLRIVIQRLEPHSKLLVLHTRWHSYDLIGYFQEDPELKNKFLFLKFPAIREDNTPLWKEQYTIEELESKRNTVGERLFSSIWQQEPLDDTSDFFDISKLKYEGLKPDEEIIESIRTWDIAKGDTLQADYTAGALMVRTTMNRIGVIDLVHGHFKDETKDKILQTAMNDGFNTGILIETGVAAAGDLLFTEWQQQLLGYRVERSKPITSKVDRATPLKHGILDGMFFIDINDAKLIDKINREFMSFPEGLHDDIIDCIAYGYNYLQVKMEETVETFGIIY